jgi:hypothetical protein
MNYWKKSFFIVFVALILGGWVLPLSEMSFAEENNSAQCIKSCDDNLQVCWNMNPDRRLCEAQFQLCMENCNKKYSAPVVEDVKPPEPKTTQTLH